MCPEEDIMQWKHVFNEGEESISTKKLLSDYIEHKGDGVWARRRTASLHVRLE